MIRYYQFSSEEGSVVVGIESATEISIEHIARTASGKGMSGPAAYDAYKGCNWKMPQPLRAKFLERLLQATAWTPVPGAPSPEVSLHIKNEEHVVCGPTFTCQFSDIQFRRIRLGTPIHHPSHYNQHPSGIECADLIELLPTNFAFAIKHLWRKDLKHATPVDDINKAGWYLKREVERTRRDDFMLSDAAIFIAQISRASSIAHKVIRVGGRLSVLVATIQTGGCPEALAAAAMAQESKVPAPQFIDEKLFDAIAYPGDVAQRVLHEFTEMYGEDWKPRT